jgi:hypothetical protein
MTVKEAEDWAAGVVQEIKQGRFNVNLYKSQRTFTELLERYRIDGALEHIHSVGDVIRHLEYWRSRLGDFELLHFTTELLGKERRLLADTPTNTKTKRISATVNRYFSSLSAILRHAVRLKWINENPLKQCQPPLKQQFKGLSNDWTQIFRVNLVNFP